MSQTTKRALAASLKKLLEEKSLDTVTIVDITEDCEVNRQTFYYHFRDIFDLIEWIYQSEAAKALGGKKTYDSWQQGFLQIFEYALANKTFVYKTYHSSSLPHLTQYLYGETFALLAGVIEEKSAGLAVRDEDKKFIANFYKYAFV
jgi:probable dihydroxyacetone kinase regulator